MHPEFQNLLAKKLSRLWVHFQQVRTLENSSEVKNASFVPVSGERKHSDLEDYKPSCSIIIFHNNHIEPLQSCAFVGEIIV